MAVPAVVEEPTVPAKGRGRLLQVLGVAFGVAVIIGNTIGSGILRTPGTVAGLLPSRHAFLLAWVAGGVYALLGVVSLAELGVAGPAVGRAVRVRADAPSGRTPASSSAGVTGSPPWRRSPLRQL